VEDEPTLCAQLVQAIAAAGHTVESAGDGAQAHYLGEVEDFDAVVLDLGLPKLSGLEVLRRWRRGGRKAPVLILTARDAWTERVEGLNAGADDYLGKPFQTAEVVARLRALVRRSAGGASSIMTLGDISFDVAAGSVSVAGRTAELTARELSILGYLMHRPGRIVSQSELMDHVYAMDDLKESNTIEVYVARLRKKLGHDAIRTIRGLGYRMG
jgi:two-component system OmpR family response regulator